MLKNSYEKKNDTTIRTLQVIALALSLKVAYNVSQPLQMYRQWRVQQQVSRDVEELSYLVSDLSEKKTKTIDLSSEKYPLVTLKGSEINYLLGNRSVVRYQHEGIRYYIQLTQVSDSSDLEIRVCDPLAKTTQIYIDQYADGVLDGYTKKSQASENTFLPIPYSSLLRSLVEGIWSELPSKKK